MNPDSIERVNSGATYWPGIVGTSPLVIPSVVVNGSNPHHWWQGVSPSISRYSFTGLERMEDWVGLAMQEDGRSVGMTSTGNETGVVCIIAQWLTHYGTIAFNPKTLQIIPEFHLISWCGNFVERHSFCIGFSESLKTLRKLCLFKNVHTGKLREITVFFAVEYIKISFIHSFIHLPE